jgi:hypothetical protein
MDRGPIDCASSLVPRDRCEGLSPEHWVGPARVMSCELRQFPTAGVRSRDSAEEAAAASTSGGPPSHQGLTTDVNEEGIQAESDLEALKSTRWDFIVGRWAEITAKDCWAGCVHVHEAKAAFLVH